jgi:glycerol-3-phosphate dehydrogenase
MSAAARAPYDLLIVGGGVNGAGIACDAAGRGLKVALVEQDDLASATSSASSKLIHGGLRYLEYYEFRLVRESLKERDVLLRKAPHIIGQRLFVLPHLHERRPAWLLRMGLFLYDALAWPTRLPRSRAVNLAGDPLGRPLKPAIARGFVYADCWVDDSRLVVLNAVAAAQAGARVMTRTRLTAAARAEGLWRATLRDMRTGKESTVAARALVNAAGPWVAGVLDALKIAGRRRVRLVKGSHLVVPRLHDGQQAYILQNPDKRVVFVLPYEGAFSLIGTTEVPFAGDPAGVAMDAAEANYICASVNGYMAKPVAPSDAVWSFAGIRPLFDDDAENPSAVTRDYGLDLDRGAAGDGAALLSVYGGKITTYRRLAEHALDKLKPHFPQMGPAWTADRPLPGGDIQGDVAQFAETIAKEFPAVDAARIRPLVRRHGARARMILEGAASAGDLGRDFGGGLCERELEFLIRHEWAETADDVLWRRTKCGLFMTAAERDAVAGYFARMRSG